MSIGANLPLESIESFSKVGAYPNFFSLKKKDDENEISIDETREMINFLSQKPTLQGNRAALIENFEDMSRNAANSILKILEEPPLDSIIILTTTKLLSILPTIRSRCVKFRVNPDKSFPDPSTLENFVIELLKDHSPDLLKNFIAFINSGCKNALEFSKTNAEYFDIFLKTSIAFCAFRSSHGALFDYSKRLLNLQSFFNLSKNTYPDKQSGIIAICQILSDQSLQDFAA